MKVYYDITTGEIWYVVRSKDQSNTEIKMPLSIIEFDEFDISNPNISQEETIHQRSLIDLYNHQNRLNDDGVTKYYIENGELYSRDEWVEMEYK